MARSESAFPPSLWSYYPLAKNWVNSHSLLLMGFTPLHPLQGDSPHPEATWVKRKSGSSCFLLWICLYKGLKRQGKRGNPSTIWCSTLHRFPIPFSILTATVMALFGLSLSIPIASAITTWPKQPSPSGFPRVRLEGRTSRCVSRCWGGDTPRKHGDPAGGFDWPSACQFPLGIWRKFQLRDVGQHRPIAGRETSDPNQGCVGIHGRVGLQRHLLG